MEKNKQKQSPVRYIREDSLPGRILYGYYDWLIATQAKCDCEWSSCLKKIFNDHYKKEIRTLRQFLDIQSHLPLKDRNPFDPDLQFLVGVAYLCDWLPCEDNVEEAQLWFRRSKKEGSPRGWMGIGYLHEKQLIAKHDEIAMLSNYTSAAAEGYALAQYRLALYYQKQSNPDREQIKDLLTDAAAQEHTPAKYLLAELYPETVYNMEYREIYGYEWAELARKQKESSTGLYAPKEEQDDDNNLADLMKETHDNVKRILPIVPVVIDNNEILRGMEISVKMLQSSMDGMWAELQSAEEKFRDQLEDLKTGIHENLGKVSKEELKDAEEFMSVLFKGDWRKPSRLCAESCDALVAAYVLMQVAGKLKIKNYAGIIISATWALEHECRRRFFHQYIRYLEEQHLEIPDVLYGTRKGKRVLEFTLGKVYLITQTPDFEGFAQTCLMSESAKKAVPVISRSKKQKPPKAALVFTDYVIPNGDKTAFTKTLWEILDLYRNKAAHADVMDRAQAVTCCNVLGITEGHKEMDNLAGALKALLWLTAPLE